MFGICLFFEPLFASIPAFATAPALIFVASGFLGGLARIDWTDISVALPVVLTIILMPLTFSIAAGISIGFLTYVGVRFVSGRKDEINAGSLMIAAFGLIWLALQYYG